VSKSLAEVTAAIETLWPIAGQEEWDASGLVSGSLNQQVETAMLSVDVTDDVVTEALDRGAQVLIAHHPLLLRGVTSIAEDRYKGELLARLIRGGCALVGVHTNGDRVATGTSATLAAALGIDVTGAIVSHELGAGIGAVGNIEPQSLGHFARRIADVIPNTAGGVRVAGDFDATVRSVALCAGAGDSLLGHPAVRSADVYITSDLRHHPTSEFREQARLDHDTALIDISHWAAEWLWLDVAAAQLRERLDDIRVHVSELSTDPWTFQVVQ
jgi:dinuclear metal center YbgI/SA1388 family protein